MSAPLTDAERLAAALALLGEAAEQIRSMPMGPDEVARGAFAILRRIKAMLADYSPPAGGLTS